MNSDAILHGLEPFRGIALASMGVRRDHVHFVSHGDQSPGELVRPVSRDADHRPREEVLVEIDDPHGDESLEP